MSQGLALQIAGKWASLSEDASVSIECSSPVWGNGSSFSFPFELDVESNRHIIGNADQITGESIYDALDGKKAVLYTLGIPVYYGIIKLDDEVEIADGKVEITLISGNLTFEEMIADMNCQDVELIDKIEIGQELRAIMYTFSDLSTKQIEMNVGLKKFIVDVNGATNISLPYPQKKYCNVDLCIQDKNAKDRKYIKIGAKPANGICFYLLYFLDCLFHKLQISVAENTIPSMEDMNRLALFSTACEYSTEVGGVSTLPLADFGVTYAKALIGGYVESAPEWSMAAESKKAEPLINTMYATSKNFPDTKVSDVINGLKEAFGIVFIFDESSQQVRLLYTRDILRSDKVIKLHADVYDAVKLEQRIDGFQLSYTAGAEDDTAFHYNDYKKVDDTKDYATIRKSISPYDQTLYIDKKTGNAYRVKIDEESLEDSEKEMNPSYFEVAQFVPAQYGDCSNEEWVEKKEIPFNPIILNDISIKKENSAEDVAPEYAVFLPVEMGDKKTISETSKIQGDLGQFSMTSGGVGHIIRVTQAKSTIKFNGYDYQDNGKGSPINEYNAGFTLGILRPGSDSQVVESEANYDGEGNSKYYFVATNAVFSSDSVDHYGNVYDYNGTEPDGVDQTGRFSLKPRAEKPNPDGGFYPITESYAQKRGLFNKFWAEYAYFVVNRNCVRITCHMELADLLNIDWITRYNIDGYVGFINKYRYSVGSTGISEVEIELYYI